MATRLYLPGTSDAASAHSPTFSATWDVTGSAIRRHLEPSKTSANATAQHSIASAANSPAGASDVLMAQYISATLDVDQTISGNVKGQISCAENNAAADLRAQILIWVWTGSGSRGTLYAGDGGGLSSEFSVFGTFGNRKFPRGGSTALSSVSALAGDRIIVEVGWRKHENATTSRTGFMILGNTRGATDYGEDETDTNQGKASWVEFSQDITFTRAVMRESQFVVEALQPVSGAALNTAKVIWGD